MSWTLSPGPGGRKPFIPLKNPPGRAPYPHSALCHTRAHSTHIFLPPAAVCSTIPATACAAVFMPPAPSAPWSHVSRAYTCIRAGPPPSSGLMLTPPVCASSLPGMRDHPPIPITDLADNIERLKANDGLKFSQEYEVRCPHYPPHAWPRPSPMLAPVLPQVPAVGRGLQVFPKHRLERSAVPSGELGSSQAGLGQSPSKPPRSGPSDSCPDANRGWPKVTHTH